MMGSINCSSFFKIETKELPKLICYWNGVKWFPENIKFSSNENALFQTKTMCNYNYVIKTIPTLW